MLINDTITGISGPNYG